MSFNKVKLNIVSHVVIMYSMAFIISVTFQMLTDNKLTNQL